MARSVTHFLPLILFVILAVIAAIALMMTLSGERKISELPSALVGKPVPVTESPSLTDAQAFVTIDGTRDAPYMVNFFASWCAPCRAEAPALAILAKEIDIIGIAYMTSPKTAKNFWLILAIPIAKRAWIMLAGLAWIGGSMACRKPISSLQMVSC